MGATTAERRLRAVVLVAMETMASEAPPDPSLYAFAATIAGLASGVLPLGGNHGGHGRDDAVGTTRRRPRAEKSTSANVGVRMLRPAHPA